MFKAKLLGAGAGLAALIEFLRSETVLEKLHAKFLALPAYWDDWVYKYFTPSLMGTPLKDLTIRIDTSVVLLGSGGLMGMRTAMSLLFGAFINYWLLAPYMIREGVIPGTGFRKSPLGRSGEELR